MGQSSRQLESLRASRMLLLLVVVCAMTCVHGYDSSVEQDAVARATIKTQGTAIFDSTLHLTDGAMSAFVMFLSYAISNQYCLVNVPTREYRMSWVPIPPPAKKPPSPEELDAHKVEGSQTAFSGAVKGNAKEKTKGKTEDEENVKDDDRDFNRHLIVEARKVSLNEPNLNMRKSDPKYYIDYPKTMKDICEHTEPCVVKHKFRNYLAFVQKLQMPRFQKATIERTKNERGVWINEDAMWPETDDAWTMMDLMKSNKRSKIFGLPALVYQDKRFVFPLSMRPKSAQCATRALFFSAFIGLGFAIKLAMLYEWW